jgi:(2Fe-2S) ferredoxin
MADQRIVPSRRERKTALLDFRSHSKVSADMPFREHYLFVCTNRRPDGHPKGSCAQKGSEDIVTKLKEALFKRGVAKNVIRACSSSCLDLCETGVTILQEPEHVAYGHVTEADVDVIAAAAASGQVVERLVVHGLEGSRRGHRE